MPLYFFPLTASDAAADSRLINLDLNTFATYFNPDILASTSPELWPEHHKLIVELERVAQTMDVASLSADEASLMGYMLAHAAWAISFRLRGEGGYAKALEYLKCSRQCEERANNKLLRGYNFYVESTVHRGNDAFEAAKVTAEYAIGVFDEEPLAKAHAYNQLGLAYLRLGRLDDAERSFIAGLEGTSAASATSTVFHATNLLLSSEGNPVGRTYLNLSQVYSNQAENLREADKVRKLESAIESIIKAEAQADAPQKNKAFIGYRRVVLSENLAALAKLIESPSEQEKKYGEALLAANEACSLYYDVAMRLNQNLLRAQLARLTAALHLKSEAASLEIYFCETQRQAEELKLPREHNLIKRLITLEELLHPKASVSTTATLVVGGGGAAAGAGGPGFFLPTSTHGGTIIATPATGLKGSTP